MKMILIMALTVATRAPVSDATRFWLQSEAKNLIAAAEEMPADKYDFHPTPPQMTFAHLIVHIGVSNRIMCSSIAGVPRPQTGAVADTSGKEALVADMKASFDYCNSVLSKVDDSALGDHIPVFERTRANVMMFLVADLADHYGMAAMYLRLNGLIPPTARH
jgi:uncharacterized damage-inducible protein DinB